MANTTDPEALRAAVFAIVNALGGALPRTPEVVRALDALVEQSIEADCVHTEQAVRAIAASEIDKRLQQLHLVPVDLTADKPFR